MQLQSYFEFFSQHKIISGNKALDQLPMELYSLNAVKPLVIIDEESHQKGLSKEIVNAACDTDMIIGGIFHEVPDYASVALIDELAILFRARGCDSIIGIGGGAVMNLAKGLSIKVSEQDKSILDFAGTDKIGTHLKPLVYIPASRGDGLEASNVAEIDHREFRSDFLYPDVVCLDPRMTRGCCRECVADTAMTALTQAVESITDQHHNPMNDAYAYPAIQLLSENLAASAKNPRNKKSSLAMANAAVISSITYSNSPTGTVFATADAISKHTGLQRGICMGALLPHRLEIMVKNKERIREELFLALAGIDTFVSTPKEQRVSESIRRIRSFQSVFKGIIPASIGEFMIPKYKLKEIAERAVDTHGKSIKSGDCLKLLETAYEA